MFESLKSLKNHIVNKEDNSHKNIYRRCIENIKKAKEAKKKILEKEKEKLSSLEDALFEKCIESIVERSKIGLESSNVGILVVPESYPVSESALTAIKYSVDDYVKAGVINLHISTVDEAISDTILKVIKKLKSYGFHAEKKHLDNICGCSMLYNDYINVVAYDEDKSWL